MFHMALLLPYLLAETPVFLVEIVGAVVALVRYNLHPRASLLTVLGLLVMLASRVLRVLATTVLPVLALSFANRARAPLQAGLQVLLVITEALGLVLVLIAALIRDH